MWNHSKRTLTVLTVALAATLLCGSLAMADKPDKPGKPGGGDTAVGTVYFTYFNIDAGEPLDTWSMGSDGKDKAPLGIGVEGEPSDALHDGARWFLRQSGADLVATSDSGVDVTLEIGDLVLSGGTLRWVGDPGDDPVDPADDLVDAYVSFDAELSDGAGAGVYTMPVAFDAVGPLPLDLPTLDVPDGLLNDWNPDGTAAVCHFFDGLGKWIVDRSGSPLAPLPSGDLFEWSPDGAKIAFRAGDFMNSAIRTINADGTDEQTIATAKMRTQADGTAFRTGPHWSPGGTHLIFSRSNRKGLKNEWDVFRVNADGSGSTNLTRDLETSSAAEAQALAWR
ncbi:TolB family protein [Planctomycetota bacterium]